MSKLYYETAVIEIIFLTRTDIITESIDENVDIDGWT